MSVNPGLEASQIAKFVDELKCPACLTKYKETLLECGHSLCITCCDSLLSKNADSIPCPICRKVTGKANLKTDFTIKAAVAALVDFGIAPPPKQAQPPSVCDACREKTAEFWCKTCGDLCVPCRDQVHSAFKNHKAIPIAEKVKPQICEIHGEKLKYFCVTCSRLVCADCERDSKACKGHESVLATEATHIMQKKITNLLKLMGERVICMNVLSEMATARETDVMKISVELVRNLEDSEMRMHSLLTQKFSGIKKAVQDITSERVVQIQKFKQSLAQKAVHLDTATKIGDSLLGDGEGLVMGKGEAVNKAFNACSLDMETISSALAKQPSLKILNLPELERTISSLGLPNEETINFNFAPFSVLASASEVHADVTFVEHGSGIEISNDGKRASSSNQNICTAFLNGPFIKKGKKIWSFSVDSAQYLGIGLASDMTNLETEEVFKKGIFIFYYSCAYVEGSLVTGPKFKNGDLIVVTLDMDKKNWDISKNGQAVISGEVHAAQAKACVVLGSNGQVTLV